MLRSWIIRGKVWLKQQCERLSTKQRKTLVYGISLVYLLCALFMIAQFFVTPYATALPIPKNEHLDRPALQQQDTEYQQLKPIPQLWIRNNKTNWKKGSSLAD